MPRKKPSNLDRARKLYHDFSGHVPDKLIRVDMPAIPREGVAIGPVTAIIYLTKRDGKDEQYMHRFAKHARPLLAVTHDGRQLLMLGGAYNFTARGIVDKKG